MAKFLLTLSLAAFLLSACGKQTDAVTLAIINSLDVERRGEIVEVPLADLTRKLNLPDTARLVVRDEAGYEVPVQRTHDGKLLFPATVAALDTARYIVQPGTPAPVPVKVCGRVYPERLDDLAWENDRVAFRAYGPALQATGERGYGYDLLAKRGTDLPVLEERYALHLTKNISYHEDHGNGMDCYAVGPTLGGGTTALLNGGGRIVYPWCYRTCEVLDNGPLRFTARLVFNPLQVDGDTAVMETRIITLDLGSYFNRTEVVYEGLSRPASLVTGIVLHDDAGEVVMKDGYMAYADPTTGKGNGQLFVSALFPAPVQKMKTALFSPDEQKQRAGARGHLLACSTYRPGTCYVYYWGFAWDKAIGTNFAAWQEHLEQEAGKLKHPLAVAVE